MLYFHEPQASFNDYRVTIGGEWLKDLIDRAHTRNPFYDEESAFRKVRTR